MIVPLKWWGMKLQQPRELSASLRSDRAPKSTATRGDPSDDRAASTGRRNDPSRPSSVRSLATLHARVDHGEPHAGNAPSTSSAQASKEDALRFYCRQHRSRSPISAPRIACTANGTQVYCRNAAFSNPNQPLIRRQTRHRRIRNRRKPSMGWNPHLTVAAVIARDDRYLLVEEHIDGRALLNQPAGHVEDDESLIEAVIREVREETAWEFAPEAL